MANTPTARPTAAHLARRLARLRAMEERTIVGLFEADADDVHLASLVATIRRVWKHKGPRWWTRPTMPLGGRSPRDIAVESSEGRERVETLIIQIEHGIFV